MNPVRRYGPLRRASLALIGILFLSVTSSVNAGTISGQVKFVGAAPASKPIAVSKDQDYCGSTLADDSLLIGPGGELNGVIVFLEGAPSHPRSSAKEHVLYNEGCRFVPRIMALALGDKLVVKNNDPKLHIVHSYLEKQTVFNIAVPFRGQSMEITHKIKKPGLLQVNCDTHAWMRGYIHVFDHPFFAVTDERGSFSLPDVPAGVYTLKAWHEKGGIESVEVKVAEEGEVRVDLEVGRWQ